MARARRRKVGSSGGWLTTYADMVTLLLTFFVLMLSISVVDVERYKAVAETLRNSFGSLPSEQTAAPGESAVELAPGAADPDSTIEGPPPTQLIELDAPPTANTQEDNARALEDLRRQQLEERAAELRSTMSDAIAAGDLEIETTDDTVIIRIKENASFPSGSANMQRAFEPVVDRIADDLVDSDDRIVVTGYTDDVPIRSGRFRSNWDLSAARAVSVLMSLRDQGIDANRLSARGMGENNPIAPNESEASRALNRRVEIALIPAWADIDKPQLDGQPID
ncbi:flagellar motor protein MotB [Guyparkeria sp. SCN-R1]|uniref:flagellar motor protein MotB n=1 Tax=Guyparkeria sp. SCN-R1 TaxID=2341113 RepID=UPI000F64D8C9|nr:flagellar motor protein MotB [Guyparkeria sp. SCN-R1]RRQ20307.1 flagellar motor protein MotB [Guyparkeria sp. SCN-R1]